MTNDRRCPNHDTARKISKFRQRELHCLLASSWRLAHGTCSMVATMSTIDRAAELTNELS
eukprot:CAMPEP_0198130382 /NCGR_PEP_ID=MMETSP1442-20131203/53828_1 /TAXON_ID= /ORGANISM="Craspedostauros australis, Strain CCMP3328" /LENGTH=59 /DNA_ID=CAMNT_0043790981 /DNA_START=224 /DNA_END=400 /DNA_ORIENTATION=+